MNKTVANGSLAHTVGNVTTLFTEFIKSCFPDNFFRHTHISTRMAYREQKREENSDYEFIKKNKPILIVRPSVDIGNTDVFLTYSLFTTNLFGKDFRGSSTNFMPFFLDREAGCQLTYMLNRIRVIFNVTMKFDTEFEQINQFAYFNNLFTSERVYRMNTALEVYIPPSIIELVSAYSGVPIKDNDKGIVKPFLDYMMAHSNKYITFKERTSSSTMDFFMYYPLSIDYVFTDFSRDDVNKKAWSSYSSDFSFTLTAEFNTVGIYEFLTLSNKQVDVVVDLKPEHGDGINIIPQFTIGNLFDKTKMENGFELFYSQAFETDPLCTGAEDVLDLSSVFDTTNIKDIVTWHNRNGIPNSVFIRFIIMENNKKLEIDKDYIVDLDNLQLKILHSDPDKTYRMNIFLNNLYVNNLMENYNSISNTYEQQVGRTTDKTIRLKKDNEIGIR